MIQTSNCPAPTPATWEQDWMDEVAIESEIAGPASHHSHNRSQTRFISWGCASAPWAQPEDDVQSGCVLFICFRLVCMEQAGKGQVCSFPIQTITHHLYCCGTCQIIFMLGSKSNHLKMHKGMMRATVKSKGFRTVLKLNTKMLWRAKNILKGTTGLT